MYRKLTSKGPPLPRALGTRYPLPPQSDAPVLQGKSQMCSLLFYVKHTVYVFCPRMYDVCFVQLDR